jgi:hypothetical protein
MMFGRYVFDAWLRGRTWYTVTNRRVLIVRSGFFSRIVALDRDRLPELFLTENSNGYGTIRFGQESWTWLTRRYPWVPPPPPRFIGIRSARQVFDLIQTTARDNAVEQPIQNRQGNV